MEVWPEPSRAARARPRPAAGPGRQGCGKGRVYGVQLDAGRGWGRASRRSARAFLMSNTVRARSNALRKLPASAWWRWSSAAIRCTSIPSTDSGGQKNLPGLNSGVPRVGDAVIPHHLSRTSSDSRPPVSDPARGARPATPPGHHQSARGAQRLSKTSSSSGQRTCVVGHGLVAILHAVVVGTSSLELPDAGGMVVTGLGQLGGGDHDGVCASGVVEGGRLI